MTAIYVCSGISFLMFALMIQIIKKQMLYFMWNNNRILGKSLGNSDGIIEKDPMDIIYNMYGIRDNVAAHEIKIKLIFNLAIGLNTISAIVVGAMTGIGLQDFLIYLIPALFVTCNICLLGIIVFSVGEYIKI